MDNTGMTFEFTLDPFILRGIVGEDARLLMRAGDVFAQNNAGVPIEGRRSFEELIDKLYKLQNIAAELNGNKGPWAYSFTSIAKEAGSDGVPVQDLA